MDSRHHLAPEAACAPPGAELMAMLDAVTPEALSGVDVLDAMEAWERLSRYCAAQTLRCSVEAGRALGPDTCERAEEADEFSSDEMRARLVLSRAAARRRHACAESLVHRFPAVGAALAAGDIDELRARAVVEALDEVPDDLAHVIVAQVLPEAGELVLGALIARVEALGAELDPGWARRRERAQRSARRVRAWRRPGGTGGLAGYDLPLDRVVGGAARVEALAAAARRAGAAAGIDALRADAYAGLLDGSFQLLDDDEIVSLLVDGLADAGPDEEPGDGPDGPDGATGPGPAPRPDSPADRDTDGASAAPRGHRSPRCLRRGRVEIRGRLSTLLGLDDLPGEVAGLGPILPVQLHTMVGARTGGRWHVVVTDDDGHLLFVDLCRRRPPGLRRGGPGDLVELQVPASLLDALDPDDGTLPPAADAWRGVLRELRGRYAAWCAAGRPRPEEVDAHARFPHAVLARWVRARDRHCRGPGCRRPTHATDLDHTLEHSLAGLTTEENLTGECRHDHRLKTVGGWTLEQPRPGNVRWTSRAGGRYDCAAPRVLHDAAQPQPARDGAPRPAPPVRVELLCSDRGDPSGVTSSAWITQPTTAPRASPTSSAGQPREAPRHPVEPPF